MEDGTSERRQACPCCNEANCHAFRFRLDALERRIAELDSLNQHVSASAEAFGRLADRLSERLRLLNLPGTDRSFRRTSSHVGFGRERGVRGSTPTSGMRSTDE
jgi:hypothetical protein